MIFLHWLFNKIRLEYRLFRLNDKWQKCNKHNHTRIGRFLFNPEKVKVGHGTYGTLNVLSYDNPEEEMIIGSFCSIATDTIFILSGEHDYRLLSTYPFKKLSFSEKSESLCKGKIIIDNDVWIGYGATILSGVHIHQGAVIGARSVVSKDVPPYSIFVGNTVIKYRFSEKLIEIIRNEDLLSKVEKLLSDGSHNVALSKLLYSSITEQNVFEIVSEINTLYKDIYSNI